LQTASTPQAFAWRARPQNDIGYLVIILLGEALGVCSAGEITNVTQAFQPSGRFWLANSQ
jgi:hypothetical protein